MYYLIAYDVPEPYDNIRNKLARTIMDYGFDRIQRSVFLGRSNRNKVENLAIEMEKIIGDIEADVRIFPMCSTCFSKIILVRAGKTFTDMPIIPEKEAVVIIQ